MKTNPNDSAFSNPRNMEVGHDAAGLTKREYFAAIAMQGFISCQHYDFTVSADNCAKMSLEYADALIAELNK